MAKNRSSQRGVVRLATSALLSGLGALLGVTACSSEASQTPSDEGVGAIAQALTCSKVMPCPPDDSCGDWTCNTLTSTCEVKKLGDDGEACKTSAGVVGVCIAAQCCTGCFIKTRTGYECRPGTELTACGQPGQECEDCAGTDSCTIYSCIAEKRVCDSEAVPDGKPCTNNSGICTGGSCCTGCIDGKGVCQPGDTVTACGVSTAQGGLVKCKSCDDGNVCNNDSCQNGVCAAPTPKPGSCNDNTVCNGSEVCGNGTCNAGTPLDCDDKNPCTIDGCDAVTGCTHVPVEAGTSCDNDANKCNGTAKCEGTVCKPIPAVDCDDNNICTTDGCTPATGACTHTNNTLDCSDNDLCTLVDKCSGGKCVGSGSPNCNDNEACTTDTCDKAKGCVHSPVEENTSCDDGNDCSTGDKCVAGKCSFVMGKDCNDQNPCTIDACSSNVCGPINVDNGTPCVFDRCHVNSECQAGKCTEGEPINCDDGNPCTADTCDAATGCKHTNVDGGDCSDNDACTVGDKCAAGKCVGTEMECRAIDGCHVAGTCNPRTGACDDPRAPNETECTTAQGADGQCQDGVCTEVDGGGGTGAGGQPGAGGDGSSTGGSAVAQGGEPATGSGGEGNQPVATAGETGEPGKGGAGGPDTNGDAGSPEIPEHVFVRQPGGCSCSVPMSSGTSDLTWLAGAALALGLAGRRRVRKAA